MRARKKDGIYRWNLCRVFGCGVATGTLQLSVGRTLKSHQMMHPRKVVHLRAINSGLTVPLHGDVKGHYLVKSFIYRIFF